MALTKVKMNWDTNALVKSVYTRENNASHQPNHVKHLPRVKRMWIHLTLLFGVYKQFLKIVYQWASQMAQWLGVRLPTQGPRVHALVQEDPTCRGAAGPVSHGC